jgi:Xaa-Pro aminopeptidase
VTLPETIQRQQALMQRHGLDALVAYSKENVAYGAGYVVPSQALGMRDRQFATIVNADGQAAMLLAAVELEEADARSAIRELYPYDEFADDPMERLAGALADLGVAAGTVGLELDAIPAERWEALARATPRVSWRNGTPALQQARMVKTPAELTRLRKAAAIAEQAQAEAHAQVREGMTEQDLYRVIVDRALAAGAEAIAMVQVAAGERSSYANPTPSGVRFRSGDVVKIDIFITEGGYFSDTGRAIVIGEASPSHRRTWAAMQETLAEVHAVIRPGISTRQLWNTFVRAFSERGMDPSIRFLGHGLGLSVHEEPFIAEHTDVILEAGMVFAIEPVYQVDDVLFHLEDNVIVTPDGVENMTARFGPELIECG